MRKRRRSTAKLRLFPDPILTKACTPITSDDDHRAIIQDILYVLTNSKTGVGLAAPQVGHLKRVIAVGMAILINPEIIFWSELEITDVEGCLSYPDKREFVSRHHSINVIYLDENLVECEVAFVGMPARIIQHEIDHLDGKCILGE